MSGHMVIIGASLTGARAAEGMRDEGFDGTITLIGDEPERPYERPPLSKDYLKGERDDLAYVHEPDFYEKHGIDLRTDTVVEGLDLERSEVRIAGDGPISFDRLLLATGAQPRRLDIPGSDLEGIRYLRTVHDSAALGERFRDGLRVVVVGAGWIGCEVASAARQKGCDVTVVEAAEVPLERVLGKEMGAVYRDIHLDRGVTFAGGTGVESFAGEGSVQAVVTDSGDRFDADLVVVGVGVTPRTGLAETAGLKLENGIPVDETLRTEAENVFAAGDVANAWHPFFERRIRVEHWANAKRQGYAAGRSMAGAGVAYDETPYFFSDQYDVGMEYVGYATEWDEVVTRGDVEGREFIAFWIKDRRILAGMNVNVWDVSESIDGLIRSRTEVDPGALADGDTELESLAGPG